MGLQGFYYDRYASSAMWNLFQADFSDPELLFFL